MEFGEVREYQPGDEIRTIDWNVTARMGRPFIKTFCGRTRVNGNASCRCKRFRKLWINKAVEK